MRIRSHAARGVVPHGSPILPRSQPIIERIAFSALLLAALYGAFVAVRAVAGALLFAAAAATISYRGFERLSSLMGHRRRLAAATSVISVIGMVLLPAMALTALAMRQTGRELLAGAARLYALPAELRHRGDGNGALHQAFGLLASGIESLIRDAGPAAARLLGSWMGTIGTTMVAVLIGAFLFTVSLYYFYLDGERWLARFIRLLPLREQDTHEFLSHFREVSLAVFIGGVGTGVLQAVTATIGYWALGIGEPLLWGLLTGAASFLPVIGSSLVWLPLAISHIVGGAEIRGLLLLAYGGGVVAVVDNLARPAITRLGLSMHPLLVVVSVLGGLGAFGAAGMFYGPLLLVTAVAALRMYERRSAAHWAATINQ